MVYYDIGHSQMQIGQKLFLEAIRRCILGKNFFWKRFADANWAKTFFGSDSQMHIGQKLFLKRFADAYGIHPQ